MSIETVVKSSRHKVVQHAMKAEKSIREEFEQQVAKQEAINQHVEYQIQHLIKNYLQLQWAQEELERAVKERDLYVLRHSELDNPSSNLGHSNFPNVAGNRRPN